jgi:formylglycine-generating enzyme required for sulfatase activity
MEERRYGILIANSRFSEESGLDNLRFPENDVDRFDEVLSDKERGRFTETFVLKNKPHYEVSIKVHQVLKKAGKNDLVLIYYAGHGKPDDRGRLHLAMSDTQADLLESTSVRMEALKNFINSSLSKKKILILDCCYSGAAGDSFVPRGDTQDQLKLMFKGRGTYIMTASAKYEQAMERNEHGVFTKYLIHGIKSGAADPDATGHITIDDLYSYVYDRVCAEGCQEPMKWGLNVQGDLIIALSGKMPAAERRLQIRKLLLENEKFLPNVILSGAFAVIELEKTTMTSQQRHYDELLNRFLDKKLEIGEFTGEWYKILASGNNSITKKQGKVPQDAETFTNTIGMQFVYIAPGAFTMGSPKDEPGLGKDEIQHRVTLTKGFYMQTKEVTVGHWRAFAGDTDYKSDAERGDGAYGFIGNKWKKKKEIYWANPGFKQQDDHPVTCVSWNDARAFIRWLSEKEGKDYRLPTEAQWEYACRAGTDTPFFFGKCLSTDQANYDGNFPLKGCPKGEFRKKTIAVGSLQPNAWGLYDMHGNVWEWCQDWYGDYPSGNVTNPAGPEEGVGRILRGGGWGHDARCCRSAYRYWDTPVDRVAIIGFRLVLPSGQ